MYFGRENYVYTGIKKKKENKIGYIVGEKKVLSLVRYNKIYDAKRYLYITNTFLNHKEIYVAYSIIPVTKFSGEFAFFFKVLYPISQFNI